MNKQEYISELEKELKSLKIKDIEDIVSEYTQHFDFKLADGYSEEEIAKKLGDPNTVARQFVEHETGKSTTPKQVDALAYTGLVTADTGAGIFAVLLSLWIAVLGIASIAFIATAVLLITNQNIAEIIPTMPYINKFFFALPMLALSLLCALGLIYCALYLKQLTAAYIRWHKNMLALIKQRPVLPSLPIHPQLAPKFRRTLRNTTIIAFAVFGILLIAAYTAAAIKANAFSFWHAWEWFQ